ncbi:MAG: sulfite oxidase, partial [Thermoanaerobaculia bacterium]
CRLSESMPSSIDRRRLLGIAAGVALLPSSLLEAAAAAAKKAPTAADGIANARRRLLQLNPYAINAETPLDALTTYLTPNDLFFVRNHWNPAYESPKSLRTWSLTVDGEVEKPREWKLADIKALPRTTVTCVLQCAGNGRALHRPAVPGVLWMYGAVGNAQWTGVRVKDLLARAGVKAGARHLHTFGSDKPPQKVPPFHRSIELEKALEDGVLAYEMNGAPLPQPHGAPVRLVVPGWAGDHWMKWLVRLSPQADAQKGFYMDTAYRYPVNPGEPGAMFKPDEMKPLTELFVKSNFTDVPAAARAGATVLLRGFAFSGAPDIARVEVSEDDGATWSDAALDPRHDPYAWRLWSLPWHAKDPGKATLLVRATDIRGSIQPKEAVWNQSGYLYNAWHAASIEVTA